MQITNQNRNYSKYQANYSYGLDNYKNCHRLGKILVAKKIRKPEERLGETMGNLGEKSLDDVDSMNFLRTGKSLVIAETFNLISAHIFPSI